MIETQGVDEVVEVERVLRYRGLKHASQDLPSHMQTWLEIKPLFVSTRHSGVARSTTANHSNHTR